MKSNAFDAWKVLGMQTAAARVAASAQAAGGSRNGSAGERRSLSGSIRLEAEPPETRRPQYAVPSLCRNPQRPST